MRAGRPTSSLWRAISSAAAPLTCGAAMLVPSFRPNELVGHGRGDLLAGRHQVGLERGRRRSARGWRSS